MLETPIFIVLSSSATTENFISFFDNTWVRKFLSLNGLDPFSFYFYLYKLVVVFCICICICICTSWSLYLYLYFYFYLYKLVVVLCELPTQYPQSVRLRSFDANINHQLPTTQLHIISLLPERE